MSISPPAAAAEDPGGVETAGAWPQARAAGRRRRCRAAAPGARVTSGCTAATASYTARSVAAADCRRLGKVGSAGDDDDGAAAELVDDERIGERRRGGRCAPPDSTRHRAPRQRGQAGRHGRQLDEPRPLAHDAVAQAEVEDRQFLLEVGAEEDHRRRRGGALDRRPGQVEELGRQPVAELGVTVLDADGVGEAGPGEGVLVGAPGAAEQGDALRSAGVDRRAQRLGHGGEGDGPRRLGET